jgi:DNA-binding MarR family transcriptional regulator
MEVDMDRAEFAARQWRKEWPEIDETPMLTLGRLAELSQRIMAEKLEPFFASHGLHQSEFDVLATLRRSGKPYALTPTQLYEATMVSSGGMTNRIDRLEKAGLVERRKNPNDRRGVIVALTEKGFEKITKMVPLHIENERAVLKCLSESEIQTLNSLTAKLIEGLNAE